MDASHLFTAALRLRSPWRVGSADFRDADGDGREPHITIGFEPGRGFMLLFEAWVWLYRLCSWMMHSSSNLRRSSPACSAATSPP